MSDPSTDGSPTGVPLAAHGPVDYRGQIAIARTTERWGLGDVAAGVIIAYLATNIIGVVIVSIAGWDSMSKVPMWGFGVLQLPLWAVYMGTVLVAGSKGLGVVEAFGIRVRLLDPIVGLTIGVVCQLLVLPALYIPIFELTGTDSEELSRPAKELASGAQSSVSWIIFAVLVGLAAPVVEELFFRGLMLRSLSKKGLSIAAAVITNAVVFAGLHFQALQFPGLFVFGIVVAAMAVVSGRLGPSMFAHIGFNMTTVVVLYMNSN